jgi:hypothetical protein
MEESGSNRAASSFRMQVSWPQQAVEFVGMSSPVIQLLIG